MQKLLESIYSKLPPPLQNVAISAYGYLWKNRRLGGIFHEELKLCHERENYSNEEWEIYQTNWLRKLLIHSIQTVPYYKQLFSALKLDEAALEKFTLNDLPLLPVLEKSTYRELGTTEMLSSKITPGGDFFASSGSTGTPTKTYYSKPMHQKYFAIFEARVNNWAKIDYTTPRGTFGPRRIIPDYELKGPFYRYNAAEKQVYFSAFHISPASVKNYLEGMIKHRVEYMTGYGMSNFILARFIEEAGLKAPKLKGVLTSSEKLTQEMRDTFRRVYQCETFDSYNGVEACNLVSECEHGRLHIVPDMGITEIIDKDGKPCQPGETGEVIATGFLNFDQPLIRYRMGDLITLSKTQSCPCGRNMPVVEEIVGRIMDTVICEDGREIVSFYRVFTNIMSIVESQVVQKSLKEFEINIVLVKPLSLEEEGIMRQRFHSQVGEVALKINVVPTIPRGPNGKFKSVISHVKRSIPQ